MAQILLIVLLLGTLMALAVPVLQRSLAERQVTRRLARYCGTAPAQRSDDEGGGAHPLTRLLAAIGRPLAGRGPSLVKLTSDLRAAGSVNPDAPAIFSSARMLGAITIGLAVGFVAGDENGLRYGIFALLVAWLLPSFLLARRAQARRLRMRAELPGAIDVMVMVLEGGAGVEQALRFSVSLVLHPSPLCQRAFRTFVQDMERGTPYELSLLRLSDRLMIDEGQLFVEVLRQALAHGTELQEPLRQLARDLRQRRLADARAAVGKATIAMTVVMVSCLLPVLMIVITAPPFSGVLASMRSVSQ
ncbi:type II secretion system F family protein [Roseococcus sp.]|uniref:type II secretion system F family protein n=1 Tax=Roseococcus sp. TaxID=2109646 RepID=UPI003BABD53E